VAFVQNAAKAHITGAELEATLVPTDNLRLSTVIGVLEPKYDTFRDPFTGADRSNEPFPRTPKTTIGSAIDYTIPLSAGEIVAHVDYAWRSEVFFNTSNFSRQDSYGLLNAKLSYEANNFSVGLWGRNLTEQEYDALILDTTGTAIGLATGFAGDPRTYGVSLGYKF
jgi:iron complex outermembrane receptor protein